MSPRCPNCGLLAQWNAVQTSFNQVGACQNCGTVLAMPRGDPVFIVTVKTARNPHHNPHNKKTGQCGFSKLCTDVTGEHHNFLVVAPSIKEVRKIVTKKYGKIHITRIEKGEYVD